MLVALDKDTYFPPPLSPRFMTCSCILDYNTVAAADKFGNIAVVCAVLSCHTVQLSNPFTLSHSPPPPPPPSPPPPPPSQVRLPQDVTDEVDEDPTGSKAVWDRGLLSGASQKVRRSSLVLMSKGDPLSLL